MERERKSSTKGGASGGPLYNQLRKFINLIVRPPR